MKRFFSLVAIAVASFSASVGAVPSATHYIYIFATDDGKQTPAYNQSLATFVEASWGNGSYVFKQHTINWRPLSGVVNALAMGPQRGRNFPAADTFASASKPGTQVTIAQWGPYQITAEFFEQSVQQKTLLDSGAVWYRFWDNAERIFKLLDPPSVPAPRAMVGAHALSDIVYPAERRFLLTGMSSGIEATAQVALHFGNAYVRNGYNTNYLASVDAGLKSEMDRAVGVTAYPSIQHRVLESKTLLYCRTLKECQEKANNLVPN